MSLERGEACGKYFCGVGGVASGEEGGLYVCRRNALSRPAALTRVLQCSRRPQRWRRARRAVSPGRPARAASKAAQPGARSRKPLTWWCSRRAWLRSCGSRCSRRRRAAAHRGRPVRHRHGAVRAAAVRSSGEEQAGCGGHPAAPAAARPAGSAVQGSAARPPSRQPTHFRGATHRKWLPFFEVRAQAVGHGASLRETTGHSRRGHARFEGQSGAGRSCVHPRVSVHPSCVHPSCVRTSIPALQQVWGGALWCRNPPAPPCHSLLSRSAVPGRAGPRVLRSAQPTAAAARTCSLFLHWPVYSTQLRSTSL